MNVSTTNVEQFDVFLCHNSEDKPAIRDFVRKLEEQGIKPWLDEEQIRPGTSWQTALGAVMISGLLFLVISLVGLRQLLVEAIPESVKLASSAGIGLFLAFIGAKNAGLVVANQATFVTLGDFSRADTALGAGGLLFMAVLISLRIRGAILMGILGISTVAIVFSLPVFQGKAFSGFDGALIQAPIWPSELFMAMDFSGALEMGIVGVIFVFFFVDFFDTAGTFLGLSRRVDIFDRSGNTTKKAFLTDAIATMSGAVIGTTSTTTYVESAAGIEEGGKTGLVAVVVGLLFLISIFLWPLLSTVPAVATAPALILIGSLMMGGLSRLDWGDPAIAIPAFLTVVAMPFTFSIANGISFGIISHTVIFALSKRAKDVNWIVIL